METKPGKILKTQVRVHFGDTDPFGVVYFKSYLQYAKDAIDEYARNLGHKPEEFFRNPQGGGLPVVECQCRYLAPAYYDDLLEVYPFVEDVRDKAIIFGFEIYRTKTKKRLAKGSLTCLAVDRDWRPISLPEKIKPSEEKSEK